MTLSKILDENFPDNIASQFLVLLAQHRPQGILLLKYISCYFSNKKSKSNFENLIGALFERDYQLFQIIIQLMQTETST